MPDSLKLLRTIAETSSPVTIEDAVKSDNVWLVRLEIESGATICNVSVQCAYTNGFTNIVRLFLDLPLERGVAACDNEALRLACEHGHTEIVRLLLDMPLERGVDPAADNNLALRNACRCGHTEIVRLILELPLERGVDPAARDNHALWLACWKGHTEIVRLLLNLPLERAVDPAARDNAALRLACEHGYTEIVRLLLQLPSERGVNPAGDGDVFVERVTITVSEKSIYWVVKTPFIDAFLRGHTDIVRLFLEKQEKPNKETMTVLFRFASFNGYMERARLLYPDANLI